jgi:hypothetical protein
MQVRSVRWRSWSSITFVTIRLLPAVHGVTALLQHSWSVRDSSALRVARHTPLSM